MIWWRCPLGDRLWSISLVSAPDVQKDRAPKARDQDHSRWIFYSFLTVKTGHFDPARWNRSVLIIIKRYSGLFLTVIWCTFHQPGVCLCVSRIALQRPWSSLTLSEEGNAKREKLLNVGCRRLSPRGLGCDRWRFFLDWQRDERCHGWLRYHPPAEDAGETTFCIILVYKLDYVTDLHAITF